MLLAAGMRKMGISVKLGMKQNVVLSSICFLAVCALAPLRAPNAPILAQPTLRVQSSLVLVDVLTKDRNSGLPIQDFKKEDFRLFDNRREVRISTFDAGVRHDTRAITLWLVVICKEGGLPKFGASAEFLGEESLFRPALNHLESHDSVGVAHWCDNGDSRLDLLPSRVRKNSGSKFTNDLLSNAAGRFFVPTFEHVG